MNKIMGIIETVSAWDFARALSGDFSGDAADVLFDYYTELSEDIGEPIEFDPIAIRCDWNEYEDDDAFISDMMIDDVEGIREELEDLQGWNYLEDYHILRLDNGGLLVSSI